MYSGHLWLSFFTNSYHVNCEYTYGYGEHVKGLLSIQTELTTRIVGASLWWWGKCTVYHVEEALLKEYINHHIGHCFGIENLEWDYSSEKDRWIGFIACFPDCWFSLCLDSFHKLYSHLRGTERVAQKLKLWKKNDKKGGTRKMANPEPTSTKCATNGLLSIDWLSRVYTKPSFCSHTVRVMIYGCS